MKRSLFALVLLAAIFIVIPGSPLRSAPAAKATAAAKTTAAGIVNPPWTPVTLDTADVVGLASGGGDVVYAITQGPEFVSHLFRSTNAGATWSSVGAMTGLSLAISPADPQTLVTATGWSLEKSMTGGVTWSPATLDEGTYVRSAVFHPVDPNLLCAVGTENAFWADSSAIFLRSDDGGATWGHVHLPFPKLEPWRISVDTANPAVIYIVSWSYYAGTECRVLRSRDGGTAWTDVTGAIGASTAIHDVAADPTDPSRVYVATAKGIFRSSNQGLTWIRSAAPPCMAVAADASAPGTVYAAGVAAVFRSRDGGLTWTRAGGAAGTPHSILANGMVCVGSTAGVFRSLDDGRSFAVSNTGLCSRAIGRVVISPSSPNVVYASVKGDGLYRSADSGATWSRRPDRPWTPGADPVAVDPRSPDIVYALQSGKAVYRSRDGGLTWTRLLQGVLQGFTIDADNPRRLAGIGLTAPDVADARVRVSRDGGATWTSRRFIGPWKMASAIAFTGGPFMYAGGWNASQTETGGFIARSADAGSTWRIVKGAETLRIEASSLVPQRLYAMRMGVVASEPDWVIERSDDGGMTWTGLPQTLSTGAWVHVADFRAHFGSRDEILVSNEGCVLHYRDGDPFWTNLTPDAYMGGDGLAWHPESGLTFVWGVREGSFFRNTGLTAID